MRKIFKKIFLILPSFLKRGVLWLYEKYFSFICLFQEKKEGLYLKPDNIRPRNSKMRILFYHISGLSFGGTVKFLQILAKHVDKSKYDVYFMYSAKNRSSSGNALLDGRLPYLKDGAIKLINFDYEKLDDSYPYMVKKMSPLIFNVIRENNIDLFISAGSGYAEFPFNIIKNIPIILINIFGSPNVQKNIRKNISISKEVDLKIQNIIPAYKREVMYIPSEKPSAINIAAGKELRERLGFNPDDFVFGRIGRADDNIFDHIGIEAFKKIVVKYPEAKYLIQSPPPILVRKVKEENIPNIYFLESSSDESKIWAFHFAIDALAHFRHDGESFGLNIAESMIAGKPIITHRSHIWNAHLEYLEATFSRVAEKDNVEQYAYFIEEFILLKKDGRLEALGEAAKEKAKMFFIENNIQRFEKWIDESVVK